MFPNPWVEKAVLKTCRSNGFFFIYWAKGAHLKNWAGLRGFACPSAPNQHRVCNLSRNVNTWDWVYFWIYLLNHNSLSYQTWPIDRYKQKQYFSEIFWMIWRTGAKFQALFNLATCSNYSTTNYVKFQVFHFFERVNKWELKTININ